ncbi:septal ring lytic transglycosylase RlpA family protein [Variovorax sp. N23]|uniref:septal ring lytic transglycosylase RlpA family protein n=1 Tax=Variovorax sp. N23 TaxID=2980555 RepID=UPI0021C67906|nr:septal ring lytic transglycosylase RlpA family protein [Variovorax sp. N23]MCU4118374.1 septal ring lytic transglycosylase RlpA family protein [Variovorax sp. N23]
MRFGGVGRAGFAALLAGLLVACAAPPGDEGAASSSTAPGLRPLTRDLSVPAGARPRSAVPSVRYDLASSGQDELGPDDGLPGDDAPRTVYQRGGASWYGIGFHMRKTANGERFDMTSMTAAHRTLPFNTVVCVRSLVNGREVLVRVNDRGPFAAGRVIDLSRAAAEALDMVNTGIKQVALHVIDQPGMRCNGEVADVAALQPSPDAEPAQAKAPTTKPKRRVAARRRK